MRSNRTTGVNTRKIEAFEQTRRRGTLYQDIGILLFMVSMFVSVIAIVMAPQERLSESLIMFAVMCVAVILSAYKFRYMAVATAALQVLVFTAYRIYRSVALYEAIGWTSYIWLFVPLTAVGAMTLFQHLSFTVETSNDVIAAQMNDLVLIHQLTGLYNQRALYIDLERQMAYSRRNHLDICLMCIELRYGPELKSLLTDRQFRELQQRMAEYLEDVLRVEDRLYAVDDEGSYAAILTCNAEGAAIVKRRIRHGVEDPKLFKGIVDKNIRVDLRIAFLPYDSSVIKNAIEYRQRAESELQYDV